MYYDMDEDDGDENLGALTAKERLERAQSRRKDAFNRLLKHEMGAGFDTDEFLFFCCRRITSSGSKDATIPKKADLEKCIMDLVDEKEGGRKFPYGSQFGAEDFADYWVRDI